MVVLPINSVKETQESKILLPFLRRRVSSSSLSITPFPMLINICLILYSSLALVVSLPVVPKSGRYIPDPDYPSDPTKLMLESISFAGTLYKGTPAQVNYTFVDVDGKKIESPSGVHLKQLHKNRPRDRTYFEGSYHLSNPGNTKVHFTSLGDVSLGRILVTANTDNPLKVTVSILGRLSKDPIIQEFKMVKVDEEDEVKMGHQIPTTVLDLGFSTEGRIPAKVNDKRELKRKLDTPITKLESMIDDTNEEVSAKRGRRKKGNPRKVITDGDGRKYYKQ